MESILEHAISDPRQPAVFVRLLVPFGKPRRMNVHPAGARRVRPETKRGPVIRNWPSSREA